MSLVAHWFRCVEFWIFGVVFLQAGAVWKIKQTFKIRHVQIHVVPRTLLPCPFTGLKMLLASQMFWAIPKIWLHFVPLQKLLCQHKKQFYWMQIIFLSGTKCLWLPQYVNRFLVQYKKFGPAQTILRSVKGQGIRKYVYIVLFYKLLQ